MNTINLSEKLSRFSTHWDPQGVVHRPRANQECKVLLIEPAGEPNPGDADAEPAKKPRI